MAAAAASGRNWISIHAPRGGSDDARGNTASGKLEFQSTLPVGGATARLKLSVRPISFQSTLPVGGATLYFHGLRHWIQISIHAPRGGSDRRWEGRRTSRRDFNPRSPWGERRSRDDFTTFYKNISIHAPRGGSDAASSPSTYRLSIFQSTLPVGGATRPARAPSYPGWHFNPRSPWGERPRPAVVSVGVLYISIHAPRGGSDTTRVGDSR